MLYEVITLTVDLMPESYTTEALLELMLKHVSKGERVLMARADIASKELYSGLINKGILVNDIVVYKTEIDAQNKQEIVKLLEEGSINFITFTSSSTVINFVKAIGSEGMQLLT